MSLVWGLQPSVSYFSPIVCQMGAYSVFEATMQASASEGRCLSQCLLCAEGRGELRVSAVSAVERQLTCSFLASSRSYLRFSLVTSSNSGSLPVQLGSLRRDSPRACWSLMCRIVKPCSNKLQEAAPELLSTLENLCLTKYAQEKHQNVALAVFVLGCPPDFQTDTGECASESLQASVAGKRGMTQLCRSDEVKRQFY